MFFAIQISGHFSERPGGGKEHEPEETHHVFAEPFWFSLAYSLAHSQH
jgi:hypothetical protein